VSQFLFSGGQNVLGLYRGWSVAVGCFVTAFFAWGIVKVSLLESTAQLVFVTVGLQADC